MKHDMWIAVVGLGLAACVSDDGDGGGDEGPRCGDLVCAADETAASCPADCAPACSEAADACTGETICIAGRCEAAFPRVYQLARIAVTVPTSNPATNGEPWDVGGGAPDLFLGTPTGEPLTATVADRFEATFPGPLDFSLVAGGALRLAVWDEDLTADDHVLTCAADPVTPALLRGRAFACAASGISVSATIQPK